MIYLGSLSKTLAHGLRLGFIVASAPLIKEVRALRRLMMRHVSSNNQRAAASFVAHGFHESHVRNLIARYRERAAQGGSALWVTRPDTLDTLKLAQDPYRVGVVVEPDAFLYPTSPNHCASMRLGYSSIATERIEPGVQAMATMLKQHMRRR